MKYDNPHICDQLAAEYVLGTMPARVRTRFETLLKTRPDLRIAVAHWEARLTPMASATAEIVPPRRVWRAIQKQVSGAPQGRARRDSSLFQAGWWSSLGFWRAATGFAVMALVVLGLQFLSPAGQDPSDSTTTMMVVVMDDTQTRTPAMTVSWEPGGDSPRILRLRVIGHAEMDPDTAWELWMLPGGDAAPVSLGLITTHELQTLRVSSALAQPLDNAWGLGMTVEPKGGSRTGAPTSPMLYAGECVKT